MQDTGHRRPHTAGISQSARFPRLLFSCSELKKLIAERRLTSGGHLTFGRFASSTPIGAETTTPSGDESTTPSDDELTAPSGDELTAPGDDESTTPRGN